MKNAIRLNIALPPRVADLVTVLSHTRHDEVWLNGWKWELCPALHKDRAVELGHLSRRLTDRQVQRKLSTGSVWKTPKALANFSPGLERSDNPGLTCK